MSSPAHNQTFRILSLDGGGIRGAFTAAFLAEVERQVKRPIGEYFDLVTGTSTGAIISGALALGLPAADIEALYLERGKRIFSRFDPTESSWLLRIALWLLRRRFPTLDLDSNAISYAKYAPNELREALLDVLGPRTFQEAERRVVIPSVDLVQGKVVTFKTPHLPNLFRDRQIRVADAALASAAAPTYFPASAIREGSAYCDGGLWANNPSIVAYAEATRIHDLCTRETDVRFDLNDIQLLSIGTGTQAYFAVPPGMRAGLLWWGPRLFDVVGVSHSQGAHFQSQYLLDDRYTRIDFSLPDSGWKLDAVELLEQLVHLGREHAAQQLQALRGRFFSSPAEKPTWFPPPADPPS